MGGEGGGSDLEMGLPCPFMEGQCRMLVLA